MGVVIENNPLSVGAEYVTNSNATGGFFIFLFISENDTAVVDFNRSVYVCLERNTTIDGQVLPLQLPAGDYIVSAYDIEANGRIDTGLVKPADTVAYSQDGNTRGKLCL